MSALSPRAEWSPCARGVTTHLPRRSQLWYPDRMITASQDGSMSRARRGAALGRLLPALMLLLAPHIVGCACFGHGAEPVVAPAPPPPPPPPPPMTQRRGG